MDLGWVVCATHECLRHTFTPVALIVLIFTYRQRESQFVWFDVNYAVEDGGWAMYQVACEIGPGNGEMAGFCR